MKFRVIYDAPIVGRQEMSIRADSKLGAWKRFDQWRQKKRFEWGMDSIMCDHWRKAEEFDIEVVDIMEE